VPTLVCKKRNLKPNVPARTVAILGNAMLQKLELTQAELSVLLTDDPGIQQLNRKYRNKDKPTDVLSFPMSDESSGFQAVLGDVVISVETAERQALGRRRPLLEELRFLLAHAILHLIGYDHGTPEQKRDMVRMTRKLVASAPLPRQRSRSTVRTRRSRAPRRAS